MDVPELFNLFLESFQSLDRISTNVLDCKGEWFRLCGRAHDESLFFSMNLTIKELDSILMQM